MSLFLPVLKAFSESLISYVVVGGLAVVLHGHSRLTGDIDIVLDLEEKNVRRAMQLLKELNYASRVPVQLEDFANQALRESWIKEKGLTVFSVYNKGNPIYGVDLFVEYPMDYKKMYASSVIKKLGNIDVRVAGLDDLIEIKSKVGRAKDLEDIQALTAIKDGQEE